MGIKEKNDPVLASPDIGFAKQINKDAAKNDFHHFIEDIYNKCKKYDIKPSVIIEWIKDLHNFFHSLKCVSTFGINKDLDHSLSNENEDEYDIISYLSETINGESNRDILKNIEIKGNTSTKQTNKQDVSIKIPFISQVSYYIDQIKLEYKIREQYFKSLNTEISIRL